MKRSSSVYRKNARIGARKRQCLNCGRKAAMSRWHANIRPERKIVEHWRTCRWCGYEEAYSTRYGTGDEGQAAIARPEGEA